MCPYRKQNPFQIKLHNSFRSWCFLILQFFIELSRKKVSDNTSLFYFLRAPGKLRGSENKNVWAKALLWPSPSASEQNTRKSSSGDDSWFWGGKGVLCWSSVSTLTTFCDIIEETCTPLNNLQARQTSIMQGYKFIFSYLIILMVCSHL